MGYSSSGGPKGLGVFNNTPSTVSDLNQLVTLIGLVGNVRVGTQTERDALTGTKLYEGALFYNTTSNSLDLYDGSGWASIVEDTGWQVVTPSGTGFTPAATGIRFRRINRVVHFNVTATRDGGTWGADNWAVAAIPVGYRPAQTMTFASSYNDVAKEVQFTAAGNVVIAKAGSGGITLSGSYPVG